MFWILRIYIWEGFLETQSNFHQRHCYWVGKWENEKQKVENNHEKTLTLKKNRSKRKMSVDLLVLKPTTNEKELISKDNMPIVKTQKKLNDL